MASRKNSDLSINIDDIVCHCCNNTIDGDCLACSLCMKRFHMKKECSGLAANIVKAVLSVDNLSFTCDTCKSINVHELLKRFVKIEAELQDMREQLNSKLSIDVSMIVNQTLNEFSERQNKRNNLILFGVDDDLDSNADVFDEDAMQNFDSVMDVLSISKDNVTHCMRIGKPTSNRKRPLKICFKTYEDKMRCFNNRYKLRAFNEMHNSRISLKHDKTKEQQEHDKALHEQLLLRRKNGHNVFIRHGRIIEKSSL